MRLAHEDGDTLRAEHLPISRQDGEQLTEMQTTHETSMAPKVTHSIDVMVRPRTDLSRHGLPELSTKNLSPVIERNQRQTNNQSQL